MFIRLLERLGILQPRYRKGWPRGVRPVFPELEEVKAYDPAWYAEVRSWPVGKALREFMMRHPQHPFSLRYPRGL